MLCQRDTLPRALQSLVRIAAEPKQERRVHSATDAGIMSGIGICQRMMPLRIIDCEATVDVLFGGGVISHPRSRCPKTMVGLDQQAFIAFGLCKFQALLAPLVGSAQVSSDRIVRCFADERDEQLVLVAELFAESPCSRKCLHNLGRAETLCGLHAKA